VLYLLEYVCSRGPLSLIFLTAAHSLCISLARGRSHETTLSAASRLSCPRVPGRGLPAWSYARNPDTTLIVFFRGCNDSPLRTQRAVTGLPARDRTGDMFGHDSLIRRFLLPPCWNYPPIFNSSALLDCMLLHPLMAGGGIPYSQDERWMSFFH
jgi:hypothetical protein